MGKTVSLTIRNRAAAALFIVALLALGAVFFTVGLALLLGLVVVGGVLGTGFAAYRALRGDRRPIAEVVFQRLASRAGIRLSGLDPVRDPALDPTLEVSPTRATVVRATESQHLLDDPPQ